MFKELVASLRKHAYINRAKTLLKDTNHTPTGIGYGLRIQIAEFIIMKTKDSPKKEKQLAEKLNITLDNLHRIMRTQSNLDLMFIARIYYHLDQIPYIGFKHSSLAE